MRPALLSLLLALFLAGCPAWLAPGPTPGVGPSGPCTADLDCAAGLVCECGACAAPGDDDLPPSCEVTLDDACQTPPSACFRECGDLTVVGEATCVNGRETCSEVDGVLASQCAPDTCWGTREPGEICVDGEWVCEFDESAATGLCYTFDCVGEPGLCVDDCAGTPFPQECLASAWACERGRPIETCGECLGPPPPCLAGCDDPQVLASAICESGSFSCGFIQDAVLPRDCGCAYGDVTLQSQAHLDAFAAETCRVGDVRITTSGVSEVSLPLLERVIGDLSVVSSGNQAARFAALHAVHGSLEVRENFSLASLELPALAVVTDGFVVTDNPVLPACRAEEILARLDADAGPTTVRIENNLDAPSACDPADGGGLDAGPDAGALDGGAADGGAPDGGAPDASAPDAGSPDGG